MVINKAYCDVCKNYDICKFAKDFELTKMSVNNVKKLIEAKHFIIKLECPTYEKKLV